MTEAAKQVAKRAEERLDKIAETFRERFEGLTTAQFTDVVKKGRFAGSQIQGRAETGGGDQGAPR
ncbi:hypothetical protein [Micromonospora costi]|uniref:Uncharacterized protein n=1 Tax=Micromonospora costi TaxID=1530042 RepID=A0A3B0AEI7_9ACTN|nr:hypothetical protein [Micromonospora costi]RKN58972.1 hypothetical protein D7193_10855 [Micromonospora costi]